MMPRIDFALDKQCHNGKYNSSKGNPYQSTTSQYH